MPEAVVVGVLWRNPRLALVARVEVDLDQIVQWPQFQARQISAVAAVVAAT